LANGDHIGHCWEKPGKICTKIAFLDVCDQHPIVDQTLAQLVDAFNAYKDEISVDFNTAARIVSVEADEIETRLFKTEQVICISRRCV
jgi:predicted oxidoreductase